MPRPQRFVPERSLVEITTRTFQGRMLLRPSPELTDIILGIIGKAQVLYGMTIHAFVFLSTHAHFLLSLMTALAILAQDPHSKPAATDRSPAPFVDASDDSTEMEFRVACRAFVDAFRARAFRLRERAREIRDMFPLWAFPPQLPFNAPA